MRVKSLFQIVFFVFVLGTIATFGHPGIGIVQDSKGNIFYTDLQQVWQISASGKKSLAVKNVHTHELYLDAKDNLFGEDVRYEGELTDKYHHRLWKRSPSGTVTDLFGERPGFPEDYGLVRDRQGNHYWIANDAKRNKLKKRDPQGRIQVIPTDRPLGRLSWLALSPDGNLLYAVSDNGLISIDRKGKTEALLHEPEPNRSMLFGIWPAADGTVYVAYYSQNAIKKVKKSGEVTILARSEKPWAPTGLVMSLDKTLWVLEYSTSNQARVRKIAPNGKATLF
jgi:streptogramin lyase